MNFNMTVNYSNENINFCLVLTNIIIIIISTAGLFCSQVLSSIESTNW